LHERLLCGWWWRRRIGRGVSRGSKHVCDHSVREEISAVPRASSKEDPLFFFFFPGSPLSLFPPPPPRRLVPGHGQPPPRESPRRLRQRHRLRYQKLKPASLRSFNTSSSFHSHCIWCYSSIARFVTFKPRAIWS